MIEKSEYVSKYVFQERGVTHGYSITLDIIISCTCIIVTGYSTTLNTDISYTCITITWIYYYTLYCYFIYLYHRYTDTILH